VEEKYQKILNNFIVEFPLNQFAKVGIEPQKTVIFLTLGDGGLHTPYI